MPLDSLASVRPIEVQGLFSGAFLEQFFPQRANKPFAHDHLSTPHLVNEFQMIPDYEKNAIAFTERLRDEKEYGKFAGDLERALDGRPAGVETLSRCRDIWCRDFMPIQVAVGVFV